MQDEVTAVWGDAVLIVGCFTTGLLDSAVFNVWSCFVSMQTGKPLKTQCHELIFPRQHHLRGPWRLRATCIAAVEMDQIGNLDP